MLRQQCEEFRAAFPYLWFQLYFATMANDRGIILEQLASLGVGACVNSVAHLELALDSGFPPAKVQFSSTGLSQADMQRLVSLGIHVNLDSLSQLEQWAALGGTTAGLRVNASSLSNDRPKDRIGMSLSDLETARSIARKRGMKVSGLHVYIGTNLQSHEQLVPTVARFFQVAEHFDEIEYLNIGGGVGVNYRHSGPDFDLQAYGRAVNECQNRLSRQLERCIKVVVEPGRKLTASCGKMVARVTDVKLLNDLRYVAVDASVAVFPRPLVHPDSPHHIWLLPEIQFRDRGSLSGAIVVGRTTFSGDVLGASDLPESLEVDDVLIFDDAGAYSQSMETRFLGQPAPAVVVIDETGRAWCQ
ncbi:MAG: diaminopimelate decarboxylase [Thermoanaerobaculia bacterium]|nr:diaminopimelate decarboxylase [Thermoanaerobaculia bacterium]